MSKYKKYGEERKNLKKKTFSNYLLSQQRLQKNVYFVFASCEKNGRIMREGSTKLQGN